jgi:hypothetical protein
LLPFAGQPLDAVPAMPPPSKTAVEPDMPAVDVPMPDAVPALKLPIPSDVCGIEPPMPEQGVMLPVVGPSGDVPGAAGPAWPGGGGGVRGVVFDGGGVNLLRG